MSVEAGIELHELVDLDKAPVCEVTWYFDDVYVPCNRTATWVADAHDEVDDHNWAQTLLCSRCVRLAKIKNPCECGEIVIRNIRRL